MEDFDESGDVLVVQAFYYVQLILEHVQTAGEIPIRSKESVLSKFIQVIDFYGILSVIFGGSEDLSESTPPQLLPNHIVVDSCVAVLVFLLFGIKILLDHYRQQWVTSFPQRWLLPEIWYVIVIWHVGIMLLYLSSYLLVFLYLHLNLWPHILISKFSNNIKVE